MAETLERRHTRSSFPGVERRQVPFHYPLQGQPPDPSRPREEDFGQAEGDRARAKQPPPRPWDPWDDPERFH